MVEEKAAQMADLKAVDLDETLVVLMAAYLVDEMVSPWVAQWDDL